MAFFQSEFLAIQQPRSRALTLRRVTSGPCSVGMGGNMTLPEISGLGSPPDFPFRPVIHHHDRSWSAYISSWWRHFGGCGRKEAIKPELLKSDHRGPPESWAKMPENVTFWGPSNIRGPPMGLKIKIVTKFNIHLEISKLEPAPSLTQRRHCWGLPHDHKRFSSGATKTIGDKIWNSRKN